MKKLLAGLVIVGLMAGQAQARAPQYQAPESQANAPQGQSGSPSVIPIIAIAGAVVATGFVLFKVHKAKQVRKARFNVYQVAQAGK